MVGTGTHLEAGTLARKYFQKQGHWQGNISKNKGISYNGSQSICIESNKGKE
jgi:hypothetical protein